MTDSDDPEAKRSLGRTIAKIVAAAGTLASVVLLLVVLWRVAGPINTIIYVVVFLLGLGGIAGVVAVFGGVTPSFLGTAMFSLGQLAYGQGWLVQHDRDWRMHPGRDVDGQRQVYLRGEWHVVEDDQAMEILGWRPFGIIWSKEQQTLQEARADPAAEAAAATDGGLEEVSRGGEETTPIPVAESGLDGRWVLALHRYWSRGLDQIADISLLARVEEITMREESGGRQPSTKSTLYATGFGILMGAITGALAMGVF